MKINILHIYILVLLLIFTSCKEIHSIDKKKGNDTTVIITSPIDTPIIVSPTDDSNRIPKRMTLGFYNCENLFDTENDAGKNDGEFTPNSSKKYTESVYKLKLANIAQAIAAINQDSSYPLAVVGLVEVEKKAVLQELVQHKQLVNRNLQIIHRESSDPRGIDGAILYDANYFKPSDVQLLSPFQNAREILWVTGLLKGKKTHLFINHWTSRIRGGENRRILYAQKLISTIKNIKKANPKDNFILMGDFNDNPNNQSIQNHLSAKSTLPQNASGLYNPFYEIYRQGLGTSVYQAAWDCFDQIILYTLHPSQQEIFMLEKANVIRDSFLLKGSPPIPNAPKRFYEGNTLVGGYSDHLPVFVKIK